MTDPFVARNLAKTCGLQAKHHHWECVQQASETKRMRWGGEVSKWPKWPRGSDELCRRGTHCTAVDGCVLAFCQVDPPTVAWKRPDLQGAQRPKEIDTGSGRFRLRLLKEASKTDENSPVRTPVLLNLKYTSFYDLNYRINRSNLRSTNSLNEVAITKENESKSNLQLHEIKDWSEKNNAVVLLSLESFFPIPDLVEQYFGRVNYGVF